MMRSGRVYAALGLMVLFVACAPTQYVRNGAPEAESGLFSPKVSYRVFREFYKELPNCVMVLPTTGVGGTEVETLVARALARQMVLKVSRVITPAAMRRAARKNAIEPSSLEGRRQLAANLRCPHAVEARIHQVDDTYVGVWAATQLRLEVRLLQIREDRLLWQADHQLTRQDGDLPFSPLSIGVGLFKATNHFNDAEVIPSMVDDSLRRMMVTLPDVR